MIIKTSFLGMVLITGSMAWDATATKTTGDVLKHAITEAAGVSKANKTKLTLTNVKAEAKIKAKNVLVNGDLGNNMKAHEIKANNINLKADIDLEGVALNGDAGNNFGD